MLNVSPHSTFLPNKNVLVHQPVLYHEIIHALRPKSRGRYIDGTLGAGGHAAGLLSKSAPDGQLLGLDVDPQALLLARQTLSHFGERAIIRQASYTTLANQLASLDWKCVDGILLDLGLSSVQLDTPERGFSFLMDGPLDMRFNPSNPLSAYEIVNEWTEDELAEILFHYGEEHAARRIAHAIFCARPINRTQQLAEIVIRALGGRKRPRHPATRTFQAVRIAVNGELKAIEEVLPQAIQALCPGGRLTILSFHSLEDRIVKSYFRKESQDCLCPPLQPVCVCGHKASLKEIAHRPIKPTEEEINRNPRARSAKLRIIEKLFATD